MRRRYCINIDECIVLPMAAPVGWSLFLLFIFLLAFFISLAKAESLIFFESIYNSWVLWLFLSGPISLVISIIISICFIFFPVSYFELEDEFIKIHRAFKKNRVVRYEEMVYVRLDKRRRIEWLFVFFEAFEAGEINTIEIRKNTPFPSFWFSSSRQAYYAIAEKFKRACAGKKELVETDCFVANSQWVGEHGSPQNIEWGGHYGKY